MSEVVSKLVNSILPQSQTDQDKNSVFDTFNDVIGHIADYMGVVSFFFPPSVILGALGIGQPGSSPELEQTIQKIEDTLNEMDKKLTDLGIQEAAGSKQNLMLSLDDLWGTVSSEIKTIVAELPQWQPPPATNTTNIDPSGSHTNSMTLSGKVSDPLYWYRTFIQAVTFNPQGIPPGNNVPQPTPPGWWGDLPQPAVNTTVLGGFQTVFDPPYTLAAVLYGITAFLMVHTLLNVPHYDVFLKDYIPQWFIPTADALQDLYDESLSRSQSRTAIMDPDSLVGGLVTSDMPSMANVASYLNLYRDTDLHWFGSLSETGKPTDNVLACPHFSLNGSDDPPWSGAYGVVDKYGVFPQSVDFPSRGPSHILDQFPTPTYGWCYNFNGWVPVPVVVGSGLHKKTITKMEERNFSRTFPSLNWNDLTGENGANLFTSYIYPWVQDRLTLKLKARWKAMYILRGYGKVWAILQHMRVLAKQQPYERPDKNKDWSAKELFSTLNRPPTSLTWGYSLCALAERLDIVSKASWNNPTDYHPETPKRPISFRTCLAAAAS